MLVGDSFMFGLIDLMNRCGTVGPTDFYYYFGTRYRYPAGGVRENIRNKIDWEQDILSRDAVIVEINEIMLDSMAWGFVKEAQEHMGDGGTGGGGAANHGT